MIMNNNVIYKNVNTFLLLRLGSSNTLSLPGVAIR